MAENTAQKKYLDNLYDALSEWEGFAKELDLPKDLLEDIQTMQGKIEKITS